MDVASMDVEQMLDKMQDIGDMDDYVEDAREKFENNGGMITSAETKINGYFNSPKKMTSANKKVFFEGGRQISKDYLELIDNNHCPFLYQFFTKNEKFTYKDFYIFATKNYIDLNEKELKFIDDLFHPNNYTHFIFESALQSQHTINDQQFLSLLHKNFSESFEDIYLQNILIKYALNNMHNIGEDNFNILSEKVDLSLSKDNFLEKAIEHKININNKKFFKSFTFKSTELLSNYLDLAVNEKWNNTIIYFCKNLPNVTLHYLKQSKKFDSPENINFERLFLYFNPDQINNSHLNQENLNVVFSKIYNNLSDKNLLTETNLNFMKDLGLGVFKFFEIAYQENPKDIFDIINNTNGVLFNNHHNISFWYYNNISKYNILYNLLDNHEFLNESLQESFNKNFLVHYFNDYSHTQDDKHRLLNYALYNDSFYNLIVESNKLDSEKTNVLIYDLIVSFSNKQIEKSDFIKKLTYFDIPTLENYKTYLDFSLSIIKHLNVNNKEEIKQTFYNVLLNKNMSDKLESEAESRTEKRLKI